MQQRKMGSISRTGVNLILVRLKSKASTSSTHFQVGEILSTLTNHFHPFITNCSLPPSSIRYITPNPGAIQTGICNDLKC